jgi:hypothetical protein
MPSLPKKKRSIGRPKISHETLIPVTFKADEKTIDAIIFLQEALLKEAGPGELSNGSKSTVIRRALQEAAQRLGEGKR